ncbi:PASTA domain-containing protein, partial [Proteus mirabilis]
MSGADWATYESTLKVAGIPYKAEKQYSDDITEGKIVSASVSENNAVVGSHVSKRHNQQLTVTVSQGVHMVTIPNDV